MIETEKFEVEFINEKTVFARPDQTILEASLEAGIPHFHACGGNAKCSTCRVLIDEGMDKLSVQTEAETALSRKMHFPSGVRLACQTRISGKKIRLHRLIRDNIDLKMLPRRGQGGTPICLGEEKELALFFLDIRNFTEFAESHLPYDVIHLLNRFHRLVHGIIENHNGKVIEVAGDGIYAVFGLECGITIAVESATVTARNVLDEIERFSESYSEPYFELELKVGIGLHAGKVIYGHVGIGVEDALSVIGFPVNTAARIEAATKQLNNSLLVSESAYKILPASRQDVVSAEIELKGVRDPCRVYLLGRPYR